MGQDAIPNGDDYRDVSATDLRAHFGEMLDSVMRGKPLRVTRNKRKTARLVIMREEDIERLKEQRRSPVDEMRDEFDALLARMRGPKAREAIASVSNMSPEELGQGLLEGSAKGD